MAPDNFSSSYFLGARAAPDMLYLIFVIVYMWSFLIDAYYH